MRKIDKIKKDFLVGAMIGSTLGALTAMMFGTKKGHKLQKDMAAKYNEFEGMMKGYIQGKKAKVKHEMGQIAKKTKRKIRKAKRAIKNIKK